MLKLTSCSLRSSQWHKSKEQSTTYFIIYCNRLQGTGCQIGEKMEHLHTQVALESWAFSWDQSHKFRGKFEEICMGRVCKLSPANAQKLREACSTEATEHGELVLQICTLLVSKWSGSMQECITKRLGLKGWGLQCQPDPQEKPILGRPNWPQLSLRDLDGWEYVPCPPLVDICHFIRFCPQMRGCPLGGN